MVTVRPASGCLAVPVHGGGPRGAPRPPAAPTTGALGPGPGTGKTERQNQAAQERSNSRGSTPPGRRMAKKTRGILRPKAKFGESGITRTAKGRKVGFPARGSRGTV